MAFREESQNLKAFNTPMVLFKRKTLPLGLDSAPGVVQNLIELILTGHSYKVILIYLAVVVNSGKFFEEHLIQLELVCCRTKEAGLEIKASKCRFFVKWILFSEPHYIKGWRGS